MDSKGLPPLTAPTPQNIPKSESALNVRPAPSRIPRRDEVRSHVTRVLKAGGPSKADLLVVDVGRGAVVVKDFAAKPWWARLLGRLQVARECRAYRRLDGAPGIPAFVGRVDAHALAVEMVEGEQLAFAESRFRDGERHVARLVTLVERLHAAGVYHQDLRGRENVLLRADGQPVLLDLAGAVCLRPGGVAHRRLGPILAMADRSALLKWKALLTPGRFTPEEEEFLRRFRFWRSLWIFNRKAPRA